MNQKIVLVALLATVAFVGATPSESDEEYVLIRPKRSYSWLPSFLGGGSAAADEAVDEDENDVENKIQGPQIIGSYPDASLIGPIVSQGRVVNGQLHYPIWRVHKYNGLHLQPLPVSLVQDGSGIQTVNTAENVDQGNVDSLPVPPTSTQVETWLSPELIQMAQEFGVTDFSNVPSLQDAMDTLGTTTKEETIEAIKEFASTEDGRALIKQFVGGASDSDNEVAASENQETVEEADANENAQAAAAAAAAFQGADAYEGADTEAMQYFLQPFAGGLYPQFSQFATFGSQPAKTEEESEAEDSDSVETTTSAGLFGRISQWTNFLNPLTNRQEIPIPPSKADVNENVPLSFDANDEHIANQNTVPLPELPELPELPSVPGAEQPPPPLPAVHIPIRYIGPNIPYTEGAAPQGGPYVRVRLPLAGFNPVPEYPVDPKYLFHGRNQLTQQGISQSPYVLAAPVQQSPIQYYQQYAPQIDQRAVVQQATPNIRLYQGPLPIVQNTVPAVQSYLPTVEAVPFAKSTTTVQSNQPTNQQFLQLPTAAAKPFRVSSVAQPIKEATHVGDLPLVSNANYETLGNAQQIFSSYGVPASPNFYITQQYEQLPAASEVVERKVKVNDEIKAEIAKKIVEESAKEEETIEQSNDNDQVKAEENNDNEELQSESESESEPESKPKAIDAEKEIVNAKEETAVEEKPTTEANIYRNLRPSVKLIRTNAEKRPTRSNIQRVMPHNSEATGKIHRADPKAVNMLPFTMRQMVQQANDEANQE